METKENSKREIKFRIWDKQNKIFIENPTSYKSLAIACDGRGVYSGHYDDCDVEDRYIIQQYTGLKDKNGKDIYEGDLLKWHEGDHELSEIVFQNGSFFVKGVNWGALWYVGDYNDSYEIVGNVFDTPELLK